MKLNKKGFTLIELLIVVAIIAILAAIAIPQFGAYRARAVRSSMVADGKNIATSVETLFQDCNNYKPIDQLSFMGPNPTSLLKTSGQCTAQASSYDIKVNASKGNTVSATATDVTYTLSVDNAGGNDSSYTGPVMRTETGSCTWTKGGAC